MASPVALQFSRLRLHVAPVLALPGFPSASSSSASSYQIPKPRELYPRDQRIQFGKFKGSMLGSLPSSYLKWLARTVDNGGSSFSSYSKLAKLVLQDPVYRDRIEWEPANRLLSGDGLKGEFIMDKNFDIMKAYREIGESFGWDMDDKEGWRKVDMELIGTSYTGRIPRKNRRKNKTELDSVENVKKEVSAKKIGINVGGKRAERIQRMKLKREINQKISKSMEKSLELDVSEDSEEDEKEVRLNLFEGEKRGERRERTSSKRENHVRVIEKDEEIEEEEERRYEFTDELPTKNKRATRTKKIFGSSGGIREFGIKRNNEIIGLAKRAESKGDGKVFNPFPGRDSLFEKIKRNVD